MNFDSINDDALIFKIETLVREERELLTQVLHVLREIDRRRLFSALGYKSLFDFAVRKLGYSEDQAYRRVTAMRLLRELPEVEEKIERGELNLTHLSLAQSLFRSEKKADNAMSVEQKMVVIEQISNTSKRGAEAITLSFSSVPEKTGPDRIRKASPEVLEFRFSARREVEEKVKRLKGFLAHTNPEISLGELFETLCDLGLKEFDPAQKTAPARKRCVIKLSQAQVRRDTFQKAKSQCENCGSTYALEIDHIHPRAKGGDSSPGNLRLFCRSCNQRAAIIEFGQQKIDQYINDG